MRKNNIQATNTSLTESLESRKRRHSKINQSKGYIDNHYESPVCSSFMLPRRPSFSSSSSMGSYVTPGTSLKKTFSSRSRTGTSSGYHSLKNSKIVRSKKIGNSFTKSIRCVNITAIFKDLTLTPKRVKPKFYPSPQLTNKSAMIVCGDVIASDSCYLLEDMINKDLIYNRDPNYFSRQGQINAQMRSVLIQWMKEVCDVYTLNSETLYLSIDYLDRYLSAVDDVPVHSFQTIGTTCLYIASKLNEIVSPSVESFVNVTDGASTISEILLHEAHVLLKINWHLQPVTPFSWLKLLLQVFRCQLDSNHVDLFRSNHQGPLTRKKYIHLFENSYLSKEFLISLDDVSETVYMDLLRACISDACSLRFPYAVIAASIISLVSQSNVYNVTGYGSDDITSCKKWLRRFYVTNNNTPLRESTLHNVSVDQHVLQIEKAYNVYTISNELEEKENIPPLEC